MKFTSLSTALFLLASEASKVWADEAVPGPVTTVKIDLGCPVGFSGTMRDVAFTIKPIDGSGAKVSWYIYYRTTDTPSSGSSSPRPRPLTM